MPLSTTVKRTIFSSFTIRDLITILSLVFFFLDSMEFLIKFINARDIASLSSCNLILDSFRIEELILEEVSVNNYAVSSGKNLIVGISTEISESLKQEGLVRDLIRQVQNLRKDSGLKVEDRIKIEINGSKELNNAVVSYESYFMNEVLGVKLDMGDCITLKYNDSVKIAGEKTIIGISPLV